MIYIKRVKNGRVWKEQESKEGIVLYIWSVEKMAQVAINQIIQTGKSPHHVGIIDKQWI